MKDGWRPPGWQNPWPAGKYLNELECQRLYEAFEQGAEAMLAARLVLERSEGLQRRVKHDRVLLSGT